MLFSIHNVIRCLEQTLSTDRNELINAQHELEKNGKENLENFITNMSIVLADKSNSCVVRQAAGLQLKNCLTARNSFLKAECQKRWLFLAQHLRKTVYERLLSTLGTESINPSCAAQCIAYICAAELLSSESEATVINNTFDEQLLAVIRLCEPDINEPTKLAAMEAIRFICEEINPVILVNYSASIIDPIFKCLAKHTSGKRIRIAAAQAFLNSLEFAHPHFERESDRNLIMQIICNVTQSDVIEESEIALQILAKIGACYYQYLRNYMMQAVLPITLKAIASSNANISLQGMEFWCSVAEIETDLACSTAGVIPSSHYVEKVFPKLLPLLLSTMVSWLNEPDDLYDLDDWTPEKGAVACLTLLSECCPNMIHEFILPEVFSRITKPDWKERITALWTISAVLEEMDSLKAEATLELLMPLLWDLTQDKESTKIRYAALLLTNRSFHIYPSLIPTTIEPLIEGLLHYLKDDEEKIASVACRNISTLFKVVYNQTFKKSERGKITFALSPFYGEVVDQLLRCTGENLPSDLQYAAHQALESVIVNSPKDCSQMATNTVGVLLQQVLESENVCRSVSDDERLSSICVTLSNALAQLSVDKVNVVQLRHDFVSCLLTLLRSGLTNEDFFLAIATAVTSFGSELKQHLCYIASYLMPSLKLPVVSRSVINLSGDLFRALGNDSLPYLDNFCEAIFHLLEHSQLEIKLQADCIAALNDIAISVGCSNFQSKIPSTLRHLQHASTVIFKNDPDQEELQDNILKMYSTLFTFISADSNLKNAAVPENIVLDQSILLRECITDILKFVAETVDNESYDALIAASSTLISVIIMKIGVKESTKYFSPHFDYYWLLNSAVNIIESNEYKQIVMAALSSLQDLNICQ